MKNPKIIFQDESLIVVDKPSGWITNDADSTTNQPVIETWVRENFEYPLRGNVEARDGIVHRLDKETSGVLLVAKTQSAFENLQAQFKNRGVAKSYIALLHGKVEPMEGTINVSVGRLPWRRDRFGILPGGRESETKYKVTKYYGSYSLVEFKPKTGRTHQIRIHAKHMGHPVVGDEFYAGRKTARADRAWCPRLFLHAYSIKFNHPVTGKKVEFHSKLSQELQNVLELI